MQDIAKYFLRNIKYILFLLSCVLLPSFVILSISAITKIRFQSYVKEMDYFAIQDNFKSRKFYFFQGQNESGYILAQIDPFYVYMAEYTVEELKQLMKLNSLKYNDQEKLCSEYQSMLKLNKLTDWIFHFPQRAFLIGKFESPSSIIFVFWSQDKKNIYKIKIVFFTI